MQVSRGLGTRRCLFQDLMQDLESANISISVSLPASKLLIWCNTVMSLDNFDVNAPPVSAFNSKLHGYLDEAWKHGLKLQMLNCSSYIF